MILKTNGKAYTIDGMTYIVGSEIAAVSESPYYGLIGTITEFGRAKIRRPTIEQQISIVPLICLQYHGTKNN